MVLATTPGFAADTTFRVGNWVGEVRRDGRGEFDLCAISVQNRAGVFLTLQQRGGDRFDLALSSRRWTLSEGEYIGAKLIIDNKPIGGFFGRVLSREMMEINLHGSATLRHRIATAKLLRIRLVDQEHGFAMADAERAMASLNTCVAAAARRTTASAARVAVPPRRRRHRRQAPHRPSAARPFRRRSRSVRASVGPCPPSAPDGRVRSAV